MIYGYARCSTNETKQDIDRQKRELKQLGATDQTIYFEYESGTKVDRIEFNKLLTIVSNGDTIVTTEVSRLTRSTKMLCDIIELIKEKQLKLVIGNSMTVDCTNGELDPMTNAFIQISGVFSELERNIISSRVKSGLKNTVAKGTTLGRRPTTVNDIPQKVLTAYELLKQNKINKSECARLCDISRPSLDKYIRIIEAS